jgi:CHAT domain-containing protein
MPETLGCSNLPYATEEVKMLEELCPSLQLESVIPPQHRNEVVKHLRACKIFHFAGHGRSDPKDPARSCLILEGENENLLTVGDIRNSNVQDRLPFLSYLSACSTGVNKADKLVDEGIHLVSAFQLAGFRHVVGTLWEVKDSHCLDVAKLFYATIRDEGMTDIAVCRGLHKAVTALRDRHIEGVIESRRDAKLCEDNEMDILETRTYWAAYIHYGV